MSGVGMTGERERERERESGGVRSYGRCWYDRWERESGGMTWLRD